MVLHAALSSEDVVVVAAATCFDFDDLCLFKVHGLMKMVFRYENDKCSDIETIFSCIGNDMHWHY